ncbi:MAG: Rpn family recombination-promoting nuclease/putative transposase [Oscillospiraceae bacterium]|nr:Rpn family recombination-promoting nuclease/putative transposase [Oscillospiraceae bacterium]
MDGQFLSPKSDIIFKLLFGDERSIDMLTDFLKAVLRLPADEYEEVIIVDPHLLREYDRDKLGILDVKVKTKTKKVIDIEIQVEPTPGFKERIIYYSSKMVTEQIGSSEKHHEIKRVISIIITNYELIKKSPKYHHRFVLYDPENGVEFTDLIEVNTLELQKIPEAEDGTELWNWLKFLSAERKEDLEMIAERSPQVKKAVVRLMELSNDERMRLLYESRQKMEWDIQSRERGAIKTREHEIAKNLLSMDMPIDKIVTATGLTREEIEELQTAD